MTNYQYRKYEGAPHSEKKKLSPEEPSKLGPRGSKPSKRDGVVISSLWKIRPENKRWRSWRMYNKIYVPCLGREFNAWSVEHAADHVVKRLKSNVIWDKGAAIFWVQAQATKEQLSPEFSDYHGFVDWLIYRGVADGWLSIKCQTFPVTNWRPKPERVISLERH